MRKFQRGRRRQRLSLGLFSLGAATVAVFVATGAQQATDGGDGEGTVQKRIHKSPEEVRDVWTPERIREANRNGL